MWPFTKKAAPAARTAMPASYSLKKRFNAGTTDRLTQSWTTQSNSPDQIIFANLKTLRARAREQAQNNDYVKRFIGMAQTNIVGNQGVTVQSVVDDQRGKGRDSAAQKAIEASFKRWGKRDVCDIVGALSWKQMQRLMITTVANDGEIFLRIHKTGQFGVQLEMIDPELVDVTYCDKYNGNQILFGIEYGPIGRPVAYHVKVTGKTEFSYRAGYNGAEYVRIPADQILHAYLHEMINQKRGIPWTAVGLARMKMLQAYEDAALISARIGASKMGFFSSENGEEYTGDGVDEQGIPFEEVEPGQFGVLPPGMKFEAFDPDYPKGEFADFMKQSLRGLSSGLGVSYNTLANDLEGVNFSSMRHGAIEERETWKCLQEWFIEEIVEPVFDRWIVGAYRKGQLTIISKRVGVVPLRGSVAQYSQAVFQGRRWAWIDPVKEIKAKRDEIMLGITSVSAIIREQGGDIEVIRAELVEDLQFLETVGLKIDPIESASPPEEPESEDSEEEPETKPKKKPNEKPEEADDA